jgi:hypothetical protein
MGCPHRPAAVRKAEAGGPVPVIEGIVSSGQPEGEGHAHLWATSGGPAPESRQDRSAVWEQPRHLAGVVRPMPVAANPHQRAAQALRPQREHHSGKNTCRKCRNLFSSRKGPKPIAQWQCTRPVLLSIWQH